MRCFSPQPCAIPTSRHSLYLTTSKLTIPNDALHWTLKQFSIASPKSSSVGPPSSFSPGLQVTLPRGYKGADDLWLYHPLTRSTPDKRKRVVRGGRGSVARDLRLLDRQEEDVGNGLRTQARRVLLQQVAPAYHRALGAHKQQILEEFVPATGYVRKYAQWLLNHTEEVFAPPTALRRRYGPEVEEALVLAWKTLNRICTKRFIPFLPSIVATLEKDGHLELNEEHRRLLLSVSAATADRLLQAHRYTHPHGLSTTKAGPLLKQQIPIRTFAQWDEAKPGFLEVDLVAHCGGRLQGGCLYTITLADVDTGWTECLPLLNRGREAVLAALQRARTIFPFPILGLDTDNGGGVFKRGGGTPFHAGGRSLSRGRPHKKKDTMFADEQKEDGVGDRMR